MLRRAMALLALLATATPAAGSITIQNTDTGEDPPPIMIQAPGEIPIPAPPPQAEELEESLPIFLDSFA